MYGIGWSKRFSFKCRPNQTIFGRYEVDKSMDSFLVEIASSGPLKTAIGCKPVLPELATNYQAPILKYLRGSKWFEKFKLRAWKPRLNINLMRTLFHLKRPFHVVYKPLKVGIRCCTKVWRLGAVESHMYYERSSTRSSFMIFFIQCSFS